MRERRDWADLPLDLIHLITNKLPDIPDFIRFRAVCKGWRSSAPLSDPPPQLPWLLECTPGHAPATKLKGGLRFYSLSTGKTGALPESKWHLGKSSHGPCNGYLILLSVSLGRLWMWNPLTNAIISLPPLHNSVFSVWPIWTGSDPTLCRDTVLVIMDPQFCNQMTCWSVYNRGNTTWDIKRGYFDSSCYWDGLFFTTNRGHGIKIFDGTSQKLLDEVPWPEHTDSLRQQCYLVEISGVITLVFMRKLDWLQNAEESIFHFYELHLEQRNQKPSWVKVSDIRNHMLFLDSKDGFSMKPVAGFKGNCIYFLCSYRSSPWRYDIATDTCHRVPCPFQACTWFLPSLG